MPRTRQLCGDEFEDLDFRCGSETASHVDDLKVRFQPFADFPEPVKVTVIHR
jgi:hypothetical protein